MLRYDSRGHGRSSAPKGPYTIELLASDAIGLLDALKISEAHFCGLSMGGMVGQVLGARHGDRVRSLTLCSTACHVTPKAIWDERIEAVRKGGMAAVADGVVERWFTAPFRRRAHDRGRAGAPDDPRDAGRRAMSPAAPRSATWTCARRSAAIRLPALMIVGDKDPATPPDKAQEIHERIQDSQLEVIPDAAHLFNIEQDVAFDASLLGFLDRQKQLTYGRAQMASELFDRGLKNRKEVLGAAHVERSLAAADDFSRPYQELVTEYCWGAVWDRPGLSRKTRSLLNLAMLTALNREDEFKLHVRAACRNGVTREEICEVLLQAMIYCGVPAANSAFKQAREVFAAMEREEGS